MEKFNIQYNAILDALSKMGERVKSTAMNHDDYKVAVDTLENCRQEIIQCIDLIKK